MARLARFLLLVASAALVSSQRKRNTPPEKKKKAKWVAKSSMSKELWYMNEALAIRSLWDPFVLSLGAGTLPRASFAHYVQQDAFFLRAYARAYDAALDRCEHEPYDRRSLFSLLPRSGWHRSC